MRRPIAFVALAMLCGIVLSTTVFRNDIAKATGLAQSVIISNTPAQAVPVREQNLDGSSNIKVHEQGTAKVNVTNSSLTVAAPAPVTGGGQTFIAFKGGADFSTDITASAITIDFSPGVHSIIFYHDDDKAAWFRGPAAAGAAGSAHITLALTRPMTFNRLSVFADDDSDAAGIGWVGNLP
jgi:hypothetical protein